MRQLIVLPFVLVCSAAPAVGYASCWEDAGRLQAIDPILLKAIAWKESRGRPNAVGPKLPKNNRALGLMQINTIHMPVLAKFGIKREDLFDACTSQKVGAWVLADCIRIFGSTWKAVGCYYAGPASKNVAAQVEYVLDVQRFYAGYKRKEQQLQGQTNPELDQSTAATAAAAPGYRELPPALTMGGSSSPAFN